MGGGDWTNTQPLSQGYWIMANVVLFDKRLTDKQKLLYCLITSLCAERGYCWASNKYLWEKLDAKEWTISNWVKALIELGYISSDVNRNKWNERCLTLGNVENHITYCEKSQEVLWNFTWGSCEKSQHNITSNITNEKLFSSYYWKTKWIDEKACTKLINIKLNQGITYECIWECMVLYNCECRLTQDYKFVKKFETRIKEFQPLNEEQIDDTLTRIIRQHKQKKKSDEKYSKSKPCKDLWTDLCETFWTEKVNSIFKSEDTSNTILHFT